MKYDESRDIIEIALGEFVSIARRGVSPAVAYDEDEPTGGEVAMRRLAPIIGDAVSERLIFEFWDREHRFEISGRVITDKNGITVSCSTESNPERPRKSEVAD